MTQKESLSPKKASFRQKKDCSVSVLSHYQLIQEVNSKIDEEFVRQVRQNTKKAKRFDRIGNALLNVCAILSD